MCLGNKEKRNQLNLGLLEINIRFSSYNRVTPWKLGALFI